MDRDLLVVGAGHLGSRVAKAWLATHPGATVRTETRSSAWHERLEAMGALPRLREDPEPEPCGNVLFSVPASQGDAYADEAQRVVRLWSGAGNLLMTSSTAVYAEQDGGTCDEDSAAANSERARRILAAETPIARAGGICLRLAGLYDSRRGPHRVWLRTDTSQRRPDGIINLIHYDDAASLCIQALSLGTRGAVYLGCDGSPLTRQEIVQAAVASARFASAQECRFLGAEGPVGKRCDNRRTRVELDWRPRFASFTAWVSFPG